MSLVPFNSAIQVYGTDKMRLQCYLRLTDKANVVRLASLDNSWTRFNLSDDDSVEAVFLLEKCFSCFTEFAQAATYVLIWASHQPWVRLAALMFDGAFSGDAELFSDESVDQVYGASAESVGPILTLDRAVMVSTEWRSLLYRIKRTEKAGE